MEMELRIRFYGRLADAIAPEVELPAGACSVGELRCRIAADFPGAQAMLGRARTCIGDCLVGWFCLWDDFDFQGLMVHKTDNGWYNLTTFDNRAQSAHNHTARDGKVATGYNGSGSQQCHQPGGHFNSLGSVFNNQVSSYALFASDVC